MPAELPGPSDVCPPPVRRHGGWPWLLSSWRRSDRRAPHWRDGVRARGPMPARLGWLRASFRTGSCRGRLERLRVARRSNPTEVCRARVRKPAARSRVPLLVPPCRHPTAHTEQVGASGGVCCSHANTFFFYPENSYSFLITAMILNCTLDAGLGSSACCSACDRRGLLMAGSSPASGFASDA